jgi:hypothetical protein
MRGLIPMARRTAFDDCGSRFMLLRNKEDRSLYRLTSTTCHDRLCPSCGAQRGRDLAAGLRSLLPGKEWRFITLTLAGPNLYLKASLEKLYAAFKRLRKDALWKSGVAGGVSILEITFNEKTSSWHPHLHVLVTGKFIPQAALSKAWYAATLDSPIVHITLVRSHRNVAHYLTNYLGKPIPDSALGTPARIEEAALALAAVRRIVSFGSCHGHTKLKDAGESPWQRVGDVAHLLVSDDTDPDLKLVLRAVLAEARDENHAVDFEFAHDP